MSLKFETAYDLGNALTGLHAAYRALEDYDPKLFVEAFDERICLRLMPDEKAPNVSVAVEARTRGDYWALHVLDAPRFFAVVPPEREDIELRKDGRRLHCRGQARERNGAEYIFDCQTASRLKSSAENASSKTYLADPFIRAVGAVSAPFADDRDVLVDFDQSCVQASSEGGLMQWPYSSATTALEGVLLTPPEAVEAMASIAKAPLGFKGKAEFLGDDEAIRMLGEPGYPDFTVEFQGERTDHNYDDTDYAHDPSIVVPSNPPETVLNADARRLLKALDHIGIGLDDGHERLAVTIRAPEELEKRPLVTDTPDIEVTALAKDGTVLASEHIDPDSGEVGFIARFNEVQSPGQPSSTRRYVLNRPMFRAAVDRMAHGQESGKSADLKFFGLSRPTIVTATEDARKFAIVMPKRGTN